MAVAWWLALYLRHLAAGAVRRRRLLEHRALKPELDKLIVVGAARRPRLHNPQPVTGRESLPQELRALAPGQRSEVIAADLEQIEGYEVEFSRRRGVALECGSAHRCKVLDGLAVVRADRDQLPFRELGPDWLRRRYSPEHRARRLQQQLEALGYTVTIEQADPDQEAASPA